MAKELLEGNAAIAEAAIRAGLEAYFGYPITPQTEILEVLSKRLPDRLEFTLMGERLSGDYVIIHTGKNNWLLLKRKAK